MTVTWRSTLAQVRQINRSRAFVGTFVWAFTFDGQALSLSDPARSGRSTLWFSIFLRAEALCEPGFADGHLHAAGGLFRPLLPVSDSSVAACRLFLLNSPVTSQFDRKNKGVGPL